MKKLDRQWKELAMEIFAFSLVIVFVSSLWRNNLLLFFVMLMECSVALYLWHDRLELCFFFIIAVLGSLAEAVFVHFGVWQYANPTFLGMPAWFPLAFGTTGLIGARLARTLTAIWDGISPSPASEG